MSPAKKLVSPSFRRMFVVIVLVPMIGCRPWFSFST